ncbi:MAG: transporter substrate-binding domain-containing protein [gamma proteobacterium symbiont of Taylorina sp.]|nr:transporter substrate-binding domain-containing protein [gamma proteobacterium symbiont of Taylorina sp.]
MEFQILTEEFPPYNHKKNGELLGISTEITREMLKRLGHPDNIQIAPWFEAYNKARHDNNIILFSTTRTPAREKLFKWVGPLVPNNTVLFSRKNSGYVINNLEEAKKIKTIGVYKDDFGELLLKSKAFNNLQSVMDNWKNITKLVNGEIELWVANELTGKYMAREKGYSNDIEKVYDVQKDYMYLAFSKTTPDEVINKWQNTLDEIKSDGTYAQIFSNWIMFSYSDVLKPKNSTTIQLSAEEIKWIKEHPQIRVAPDPDYAPFQFTDTKGKSQGLANDYLALIEKKLGIQFDMVHTNSWSESLEAVKNHHADMVVVAAKTAVRGKYMSFTSAYAAFPDVIITRKNNPVISSIVELYGKKLATVEGFAINDYITKYYPEIKLVFKDNVASVLNGVSMGEYDATVLNVATASHAIEQEKITNLRVDGDTGFTYKLSFASRKDWPRLNRLLEKALNSITGTERKMLLRKWISVSYTTTEKNKDSKTVILTDEEKAWLQEHQIITSAPDPNWAPVEFFDENGKYSGMTADYIEILQKRLGVKFHLIRLDSWDDILKKASAGEIDMLTAAAVTPNRKKNLLFTEPYLKLRSVIVVNNKETDNLTMEDLNGKVVTVVSGYANQEYMQNEYPKIHLKLISSVQEGLRQVSYGKAYAFIGSIATVSYIIEKEVMANLRIAGEAGYMWNLSFASYKGQPILHQILSKGLASITKEEHQKIFSKWIIVSKAAWKPSRNQLIALLMILAVIFVISIFIWNRLLVRQVRQRTIKLNETLAVSEELRKKADKAQLLAEQSQRIAEQANLSKSRFFAAASHDLRQPLHALGLFISALKQNYNKRNKEKDDVIFDMIHKSLSSQKELFNSVLDASKLDAGVIQADIKNFALSPFSQELESEFSTLAEDKNLLFAMKIESELIVSSDELLLKRVLRNLLNNAIRYTREGSIQVNIRSLENNIEFSVSDTGSGISAQEQDNVFTEFYQIKQTDKKTANDSQKGLGLGLSIVVKLVGLLGTKIKLVSELGKGSIFSFILPKGLSDSVVERRLNRERLNNWDLTGTKILIIDDDEAILYAMKCQLESWECQANTYTNHFDCLTHIKEQNYQPDLVLMDYRLDNGIKGTEVIPLLLTELQMDVPVIIISADTAADVIEEINQTGFQLLHKPVSPAVLRMSIQKKLRET